MQYCVAIDEVFTKLFFFFFIISSNVFIFKNLEVTEDVLLMAKSFYTLR